MMSTKISVIIPVLNEAKVITGTLLAMQPLRRAGHELVIADGGSTDASVTLCRPFSDGVIHAPRGRSRQMNAGAKVASGSICLFLHADTLLPEGADQLILSGMKEHKRNWGRFDVHLSGKHPLLRIVEGLMNWRSRISGIATGDQAIFVRREIFEAVGGFPDIEPMEDILLSKSLKKIWVSTVPEAVRDHLQPPLGEGGYPPHRRFDVVFAVGPFSGCRSAAPGPTL